MNNELRIMNKSGFTLLETIIYSGLITLMLSFMVVSVYQMIDSRDRLKSQREVVENRKLLNQKLSWLLQSVSVVNSPASGATGLSLSVNKIGASDNPYVMSFSNGKIWMASGANPAVNLTNNYATVSSASFENMNLSGRNVIRFQAALTNPFASSTIDTTFIIN